MTVQSEIYDLPNESNSFNNQNTSFSKEMGFTVITQHKAQSTNSLNLVIPFSTRSSLWNEPSKIQDCPLLPMETVIISLVLTS